MIKKAGVILGLNDNKIILTKRSSSLRSFSGQICLPGGTYDQTDDSIVATAVREFKEELIFIGDIQPVFCMLPEISVVSGHAVFPIIAKLNGNVIGYNHDEVERVLQIDQADLKLETFKINSQYPHIKHNKCFEYQGELIWGLTAHILYKYVKYYIDYLEI